MSNRSKSLIIITVVLLLKTTYNKMSLIDSLTSGRTNTWGTGHKIPHACLFKSSNLLNHRMLPLRMKNSITIRSWLKKSSDYESRRRVIVRGLTKVVTTLVRGLTKVVTTSNKLLQRGGHNRRTRWCILKERRRWHIIRELIQGRWSI
jgi:hypothetical protein